MPQTVILPDGRKMVVYTREELAEIFHPSRKENKHFDRSLAQAMMEKSK